jgi:hypothetical protein
MAILTVGQIVARVGWLLDDPGNRRFSSDYIMPGIDQENESLEITLERLGVQQQEQIALIALPAAPPPLTDGSNPPVDLAPYFAAGQPLEWFLRPKRLDWKVTGQPDTSYSQANAVNELADVQIGNLGVQEYRWAQGSIQLTPSYTPVTIRLYFYALSTDIYDNAQSVMRGIGFILALQVAAVIAASNNNMGKAQAKIEKSLARDKQNLCNLLVMQAQAQNIFPRGTKRGQGVSISAGGTPYI